MNFIPPYTHDIKILGESLGPINCSAACYPQCQYEWTKQSRETIQGSALHIVSLTKGDDGIYSCKAWNDVFTSGKTMEFNLTVNCKFTLTILVRNSSRVKQITKHVLL